MREIIIEVTQEDIELGVRSDPCNCPLARAISRFFPGSEPYINCDGVAFAFEGERVDIPVSDAAVEFMDRFDEGDGVMPAFISILHPQNTL